MSNLTKSTSSDGRIIIYFTMNIVLIFITASQPKFKKSPLFKIFTISFAIASEESAIKAQRIINQITTWNSGKLQMIFETFDGVASVRDNKNRNNFKVQIYKSQHSLLSQIVFNQ